METLRRDFVLFQHQLRFDPKPESEGAGHRIKGYAAMFNKRSQELWPGTYEELVPGCFRNALIISDVTCNINHNNQYLLGRTSAKTLAVSEDEIGLAFDNDVPDVTYARDLGVLMGRGDMRDCSFAFTVKRERIEIVRIDEHSYVERIHEIEELFDVSVVVRGAYSDPFSVFRSSQEYQAEALRREAARRDEIREAHSRKLIEATLESARLNLRTQGLLINA